MDSVVFSTPLDGEDAVEQATFDEPRQRLAVSLAGGGVSVWQREQRQEDWHPLARRLAPNQRASQLAWAPAEHGRILAVASVDGEVSIWEERPQPSQDGGLAVPGMERQAGFTHSNPILAAAFAPGENGLQLTLASANGLSLYAPSPEGCHCWALEGRLDLDSAAACRAFAWRPTGDALPPMLAIGTSQGVSVRLFPLQLWRYCSEVLRWRQAAELQLPGGADSLAWAPPLCRPTEQIAVAAGASVTILSCQGSADAVQVSAAASLQQTAPVASLSWNTLGTALAVATTEPAVAVWRQDLLGDWKAVDRVAGSEAAMRLG